MIKPQTYSRRSDDHARPPCESHILVILQTPAHRPITDTLLSFLKLFQQTKITRDFNSCKNPKTIHEQLKTLFL